MINYNMVIYMMESYALTIDEAALSLNGMYSKFVPAYYPKEGTFYIACVNPYPKPCKKIIPLTTIQIIKLCRLYASID